MTLTAVVTLPPGRAYEEPEMLVVLSPTVRRMIDRACRGGGRLRRFEKTVAASASPSPPNTTADRAGDLLAASSAMTYLRSVKGDKAPEAESADRPDSRPGRRS